MTDPVSPPSPSGEKIPLRHVLAIYGVGTFSTTTHFMLMVIVPIWALVNLGIQEGLLLGIVLGCRPALPLFLSIHAGNMMDKIGTRRVLMVFALLSLVTPFLYPAFPFIGALIVIQLLSGLCDSIGWLGAQTLVGQVMKGRTSYASKLGAVIRIGHMIGPPAVGALWDFSGPWAAFSLVGVSGLGFVISVLMLPPVSGSGESDPASQTPAARPTLKDVLPRASDYAASFRLLSVPAIAITVMIGMMVHVGNNIQSTFYIVWLDQYVGIPATLIGLLFSFASIAAAIGSLIAIPLRRRFKPYWLLWFVVFIALILISITPLLSTAPVQGTVKYTLAWFVEISPLIASYIGFVIILSLRSVLNGVHQPLVITLMLRNVGPNEKGRAIGLRGTMNRVTSMVGPLVLGALAGAIGLEYGFYVIGVISTIVMLLLGWKMLKHPEIHEIAESGGPE
jgi:MFS family permease